MKDYRLTESEQRTASVRFAVSAQSEDLFPEALLDLLVKAHLLLENERQELLERRLERQARFDAGELPAYLDADSPAATEDWQVAELPKDLLKRRVEITGPVNSPKMVINMLSPNAEGIRADCAMLDFEDSMKPSWSNVLAGLENVIGAAKGELEYLQPASGTKPEKKYSINKDNMPLVMVRCRGLHLNETNFSVNGEPVSAGLFDLVACYFHSANALIARGQTPKYYVPKVEHYLEARWWEKLFCLLEDELGHARSTLRATFLVETLPATFQIEEILYEIRAHAAGLNVGRWDKIFSDIKVLRNHPDRITPDRAEIGMNCEWMKNYALRVIEICHKHGASAMGGMAAFTPGKDAVRREEQTAKVKADKKFEFELGHDGCWVSHPYFIGPALEQFSVDNQLSKTGVLENLQVDILPKAIGTRTEAGLRTNVRVGIAYIQGWRSDIGCVAWDDLMEDLATLEISRAQVWQWRKHGAKLEDGREVNSELIRSVFFEEASKIKEEIGTELFDAGGWKLAADEAMNLFLEEDFREFLSLQSDFVG